MLDLLDGTLRSLRAHALRFSLTSLGILWGAFMLTYLSASVEGTNRHFTRTLETTGPKMVMLFPGTVIKNRVGERGARAIELDDEDVARLAELQSVEQVSANVRMWNRILRTGRTTKLLNVSGVSPEMASIRRFEVAEGRFITPTDVDRADRVAFLGSDAAKRLFGRQPAVGRRFQLESHGFRVVGVAKEKGKQLIGLNGRDDRAVFIPYTTAQRLIEHSDVVGQVVFAPRTRESSYDAIWTTRQILGLHHDFAPELDHAVTFFNVYDVMKILLTIFFGLRIFLLSASVVTLMVGAIGVMNIMLVVVGERTNEIGLRKAVGASSRSIFFQFLAEAAAVCGISGTIGAVMGVAFTRVVAALTPVDSPFQSVPILDPASIAITVSALIVVGIVAGVVPAIRAAQVDPADALRAT